jgi:outer membrane receptor protein involved in Fe transport
MTTTPRSAVLCAVASGFAWLAASPAWAQGAPPADLTVVANAPLPGTGIDADKIAGDVQTVSVPRLTQDRLVEMLPNLIATQLPSVSLNNEQGNQYQPDFVYRGFEASPISGVAQGIAVYQEGVRLNESFGDGVDWDLVPEFAVQTFTVQTNNPVFGLNALGGAVTLTMKDGLSFQGVEGALSAGSFSNITGGVEGGGRFGDFGLYLGVGAAHDYGFRYQSETTLRQLYGDLAYQHRPLTLHLSVSAADNTIAAAGPTPVQLLAVNPKAVFTLPQSISNRMQLVQLRGTYQAQPWLTFSASLYERLFDQRLVDGNTTDVDHCVNDPRQLCLEGDGVFPHDALYSTAGLPVPASVLPADATPGETDFTHTATNTFGGAVQAAITAPLAGRPNNLVIGASIDQGTTDYGALGELGTLLPTLQVVGSGVVIDQGLSPTASPPIEEPVNVRARNTYIGAYAIDVLDLTRSLSLTLSGRWNEANINLSDRLGAALNGEHTFSRFNPGVGLTYQVTPKLTAYAGYSESNRAPTAAELSCADPTTPCLLDAFLVADPPLKQVVSHTFEAGLRGHFTSGLPGTFSWSVSAYLTDVDDDILLLATNINGFGFFQNAGQTRRQGVDARIVYRDQRWAVSAGYSYLEATFQTAQLVSSNSPAANADGLIQVRPGDQIPLNPQNRLTLSIDYAVTHAWSVGGDLRWQSGQYLAGDESNAGPKLPGFTTLNLHTSYQLTRRLQLFAEVRNALDAGRFTYGAFTELDGLPPKFDLTDPRTYSPSPPRTVSVGARLQFGD